MKLIELWHDPRVLKITQALDLGEILPNISDLRSLFETWKILRNTKCDCPAHDSRDPKCAKEKAWKAYCDARDLFVSGHAIAVYKAGDLFSEFDEE